MREPSADLQSRLQAALGVAYRIEKELGGGGMSRVFLAEEVRLGRKVVIKVLPPEMAAGVNVDRFEREIQLAARLQHPHIVPLLSAGAEGDLLYYIMPYIEGESLRTKLAREGELPIPEVVRILREVLDALQYAHSERVVHRDIKPDNVMISRRHALVTDFGVAKAVSESTGESSLTSLGVALGTPAYMAPEQAAADPHVDHRADIYAIGALAYEMLTGRPPFTGPSPQAVLAAHITQTAEPLTTSRPTVPAALNELVLRCLHKRAADRPQRADELIPHLDALLTPTGGLTPTATQPVAAMDYAAMARQAHPLRVGALFVLAGVGVLALVFGLVRFLGLPDWVFYGAAGLLAAGLPIMVITGHQERRRAAARATGMNTATPTGLARHVTWRKALLGGGLAFGALALLAGLFMLSRTLGVGPGATLLSAGVLDDQERLIVSNFENQAGDSALAGTVTELARIALSQSSAVTVLEARQVSEVLTRMQRDPETPVTATVATEMAAREGIKAYVAGEVRSLGSGYLISARLVEAASGRSLISARETASDAGQVIEAVDRLAATLREKIGESLRTVRTDPPLEDVTTGSLGALRLYAQADRMSSRGDFDQAIASLEQAVAQDSTFAMAWRRLGMYYGNRGDAQNRARGRDALQKAYDLRDRLSDRERYHVEAGHASRVLEDEERAITAYLAIVEKYPLDPTALNNLGVSYGRLGRIEDARRAYRRAVEAKVAPSLTYTNLIAGHYLWTGEIAAADTMLGLLAERFPESEQVPEMRSQIALARQDFPAAEAAAHELLGAVPQVRMSAHNQLSLVAWIRGRLLEARRERGEALRLQGQRTGMSEEELRLIAELNDVERQLAQPGDPGSLVRQLDALWARDQTIAKGRPATQRRYMSFIWAFAVLGEGPRARQLLEEYRAALTERERSQVATRADLGIAEGAVSVAEGRIDDGIAKYEEGCRLWRGQYAACEQGAFPWLAQAYDRAGNTDSAIAIWERWVSLQARNSPTDWAMLAPFSRRLGELYEAKGNGRKAIEHYGRFVELWKDADPELQPRVREVRERIARLAKDAG